MRLQWLGNACFLLESRAGTRVLIDPFHRSIGLGRDDVQADAVVFSHTLLDHYDPSAVPEGAALIIGDGHAEVKDLRLLGVQAYHDDREGLLAGSVTMYGISVDGFRVVFLSDLGEELDDARMRLLGRPHVLLFPAGEHTTISLAQAAGLVKRFNPNIAIPFGYHLPGLLMPMASLEKVKRTFPDYRESKVLELSPGQKLAPATEIRILDYIAHPRVAEKSAGPASVAIERQLRVS